MEDKVEKDGIILSDDQVAALEKKKHDDEACGEIETAHPGYLGSQDTFYVGNLKVSVVFINKLLSIPTVKSLLQSFTQLKHRSQQPIYSTIRFYLSLKKMNSLCYVF